MKNGDLAFYSETKNEIRETDPLNNHTWPVDFCFHLLTFDLRLKKRVSFSQKQKHRKF